MFDSKKKIFHYIFISVIVALVFAIDIDMPKAWTTYTNYNGVVMTRDEYLTLVNLGFTENEIYYMEEDIFNENKDLDAELLLVDQKYYKTIYPTYGNSYTVEVTEDEYYNHDNNTLGTVTANYRTIVSTISANGSYYRYKGTMSWNGIPSNKSYDVIGIGFSGRVHIYNGITFYYSYTTSSGATTTSYSYFDKLYDSTGGTTTYKLPSSFIGESATMYFNVAKDSNAGTITSLNMCADYAHATQTVTGAQAASHSIDIGGIHFDGSVINYFDNMPCASESLSVNW